MSTTHPIAPEEIMALLDGELSADRTHSISLHVEDCAECRQIRDSLTGTSQSLSGWTVPMARAEQTFENRLSAAALNVTRKEVSVWSRVLLAPRWKLAASALGILCVGAWLARSLRTNPQSAFAPRTSHTVAMVAGAERQSDIGELNGIVDYAQADKGRPKPSMMPEGSMGATIGKLEAGPNDGYRGWLKDGAKSPTRGKEQESDSRDERGRYELAQAPMIARTAWLSVVVKDFPAARASLDAILQRHRGYAASLTANTELNSPRSLQASLRIPAAELSVALAELKSLGRVENETQGGEEVTQQHADLIARLKNSRQTEQRLQAILLQRAGKISDVLAVEQEIARVRGEIERMEAEQKSLEHRVDFASVDLRLAEEYQARLTAPSPSLSIRLRNAVVKGYRSGFETAVGIILFILEVGPSLLLWLIIFSPVGWFLRRRWLRAQTLAS